MLDSRWSGLAEMVKKWSVLPGLAPEKEPKSSIPPVFLLE